MKKRGFLLALVLVFLLGLMPLPAQAEGVVEVNSQQTLTLQPGESQFFTFTAPSDGEIVAYTPIDGYYYDEEAGYHMQAVFNLYIYDSDNARVSLSISNADYNAARFTAEAGKTYKLEVCNGCTLDLTSEICLEEMKPATGVEIGNDTLVEYVGEYVYLDAEISPVGCFELFTWTVSDETVIRNESGNGFAFGGTALKAGTATVTVTTESGYTDSVTVTIKEKETLSLGDSRTLTLQPHEQASYSFVPEQDGSVAVYMPYGELEYNEEVGGYIRPSFHFEMRTEDYRYSTFANTDAYSAAVLDVEAGKECTIIVTNYDPIPVTGTFFLDVAEPAQSVEITNYSSVEYVGDHIYMSVELSPDPCFEACTWTVSDETVISNKSGNGTSFSGTALKPGTATVTVTTASGKTDSVTVTVKTVETISVGESRTLTLAYRDGQSYQFTAEKDGYVVAYMPYGEEVYDEEYDYYYRPTFSFNMRDLDYNHRSSSVSNSTYYGAILYVEAGETYTLDVTNYELLTWTGTFFLEEAKSAESVELDLDWSTVYVGDYVSLQAFIGPETSFETCTWTVSDETVLRNESGDGTSFWGIALKPGTVTVTVTTASGKTDSATVTVKEKEVIRMGESKTLTLQPNESQAYTYTAEKTGEITVYMPLGEVVEVDGKPAYYNIFSMNLISSAHEGVDEYVTSPVYDGIKADVVAGETYSLWVYNEWRYPVTATFTLDENKPLESFVLSESAVTLAVGDKSVYLEAIPTPETAFETYTWTSSNPGVCSIRATEATTYVYLDPVAAGTATITATSANGKSASCVVTVTGSSYVDVTDPNAYYYNAVMWAAEQGITAGYGSSDTFCPDIECNRAQIVTFLWRAAGSPAPENPVSNFVDVTDPGAYYYNAVLWAAEQGITAGYGATNTFCPDVTCTRGQVVTFLNRFAGSPAPGNTESQFVDVADPTAYYYNAVLWAAEQGITAGYGAANTFCPDRVCSRGEIVTFLYRAVG